MSALIKFGDYALAHGRLLTQLPEKVRERSSGANAISSCGPRCSTACAPKACYARTSTSHCVVCSCSAASIPSSRFDPKKPLEKVADQLSTMFFEGVKPAAGEASREGEAKHP